MPAGASPSNQSPDHTLIEYTNVGFGDTVWSDVVMHFDAANHLKSMSFVSKTLDFDTLKKLAQAQYDSYVASEVQAHLTSETPVAPMQVRICEQPDQGVVMTFEAPSRAL